MRKTNSKISISLLLSSLVMLFALAWLTVSLPYVYASSQALKTSSVMECNPEDETAPPLPNTTEEKTENGSSSLSEYLHDILQQEHKFEILTTFYKCHPSDLYFAFHPELISPPPEA